MGTRLRSADVSTLLAPVRIDRHADVRSVHSVAQIDQGVTKGSHYVVCELQGQPGIDKGRFKIYGVFST